MNRDTIQKKIIDGFYNILNINFYKKIGSTDYNLLMDKNIEPAEIVFLIKNIIDDINPSYDKIVPFEGEVTINNIVRFIEKTF